MGRDFFKIQKNIDSDKDGYQFTYYPSNNHEQNIGCSIAYDSYKEAKEALEQFRSFVKINNIKDMHSPYITIVKLSDTRYQFEYRNEQGDLLYRYFKVYSRKYNCNGGIASIYNHIDAELIED